ncbi:MAG TPA: hypothetical protein ENN40_07695 [Candidatus Aminicenantes bacterium]|nr:hypothetical protein [Candidatus Aminicenantes bacterium]
MLKKVTLFCIALCSLASFSVMGHADDIKGYILPEYYITGSNHNDAIDGQHGFWLRRIYFGYNTDLGNGWSARVRFEMNSPAFKEGTMDPYIKNAHLAGKLGGDLQLIMGIIEPPSFDRIEKFWGYRYIEKTAQDFFKFASSRDFGVALTGNTKSGLVYTVMYGNYGSNKGEDNKGKAVYGRIGYDSKSLFLDLNGYYAADNGKDYTNLTLFGGLKGDWGRFGVGYHYLDIAPETGDSTNNGIISAFAVVNMSKKSELFVRYDHLTNENFKNPGGYVPIECANSKARFVIAGMNFRIHKMIQFSPNVKYVFFGEGDSGIKHDSDFYINLTAKIDFKTKI